MKKLYGFLAIIIFAMALCACANQEAPQAENNTNTVSKPAVTNQASNTAAEENSMSYATIADAMSKSIPLKCTYTDPDGMTLAMHIKGTAMRADAIQQLPTDPMIHEIIKDNKVYIWTEGTKQGMMMDFSKATLPEGTEEEAGTEVNSPQNIVNNLEQQKQTCAIESADDSMFELPSDVTFMELPMQ